MMGFKGILLVVVLLCGFSRGDFEFEPNIQGKITEQGRLLPASCNNKQELYLSSY
jgi:hypothetical protein